MNGIARTWRTWKHGRKFAKKGKGCRFPGKYLEVDGHVELGDYCRFRNNVILRTHGDGKIIFGDRCGCSYYCIIEATSLVQIGSYTAMAEFTVIRDTDHLVLGTDVHWRHTPQIARPVIIGESCMIGSRCYISPGVTIGDGAVLAQGSVVTKDIGPYEIWGGMPARFIAHRTKNVSPERLKRTQRLLKQFGIRGDRHVDVNDDGGEDEDKNREAGQ